MCGVPGDLENLVIYYLLSHELSVLFSEITNVHDKILMKIEMSANINSESSLIITGMMPSAF